MSTTVYRVNFLRAKARYDRWEEELKIVRHEMGWCVLYFKHHQKLWWARAEKTESKAGHHAYALKQIRMWEEFEKEALSLFRGKMLPNNF